MEERVKKEGDESDSALFWTLMNYAEMIIKIVGCYFVAHLEETKSRSKYRIQYRLVRADGIGEWVRLIHHMVEGKEAKHLLSAAWDDQEELTVNKESGTWQYKSVIKLKKSKEILDINDYSEDGNEKLLTWFKEFPELRNETRGHGATKVGKMSQVCPHLNESIANLSENLGIFNNRDWAYLDELFSGRCRVTKLSSQSHQFEEYNGKKDLQFSPGIYVHTDSLMNVKLIHSDPDGTDLFVPNGGFKENKEQYEAISYITDDKKNVDASAFMDPPDELPETEASGLPNLETKGRTFTNVPEPPSDYISRPELEGKLEEILKNERHPVVTLHGRGGIGKTSLALEVINNLCSEESFFAIFWFTARNVDLLLEGPKSVKPQFLTLDHIAQQYVEFVQPEDLGNSSTDKQVHFLETLTESPVSEPYLFVFDNFETARNKGKLYRQLDQNIRLPNKILITTRSREFKGDYPIEVNGMDEQRAYALIDRTAETLKIDNLNRKEKRKIFTKGDGHPYVMKMLLSQFEKSGELIELDTFVSNQEDLLEALFETTYKNISKASKRIFLTLCNWGSVVPKIALETVYAHRDVRLDVDEAIKELEERSFVDVLISSNDDSVFLHTPLVTSLFGEKKLSTDAIRPSVEADTEFLYKFGPIRQSDIPNGITPRIRSFLDTVAEEILQGDYDFDELEPTLKFLANKNPESWLDLSELYLEVTDQSLSEATDCLQRLIQAQKDVLSKKVNKAWEKLIDLYAKQNDYHKELYARVELSKRKSTPYSLISNSANRLNSILRYEELEFDSEEKKILIQELADVMYKRIKEANATDCSRLAWLFIHLRDFEKAKEVTLNGLRMEPNNEHCIKLAEKPSIDLADELDDLRSTSTNEPTLGDYVDEL